MDPEYVVEIVERGFVILYQKINGILTQVGKMPDSYAVDRVIVNAIKETIETKTPFMKAEGRALYEIPTELGEALKAHVKAYELLPSLDEKLLYIDRTQIFTLLKEKKYSELRNRLNVYYLVKKVEGEKDESK